MKKQLIVPAMLVALSAAAGNAAAEEYRMTFNAQNVILPSSEYTPDSPYQALVYVVNTGRQYGGGEMGNPNYNVIWGTPLSDANGNAWYAVDYEPVDDSTSSWTTQQAPFSSDATYLGHTSYQWVTVEIMGEIYMRRTFNLDEVPANPVYLACGHDDAPSEWYINGTLVHTASDGWDNDEYVLLTDEQKSLLKAGENLIAVHVHQNWGGAFADCGLYEADVTLTEKLLSPVEDGAWDCKYYMLNYNSDISVAEDAQWYALEEDESDWIEGVGPFSNDDNMFYTTEWPSQLRPILIRRHFELTAEKLLNIDEDAHVILECSYDENPIVYLNGSRIWSAEGWNDNDYAKYELTAEQRQLLKAGDNVLAVSLTQGGGGGHIDYALAIEMPASYDNPGNSGISTVDSTSLPEDNRVYDLFGRFCGDTTDGLANGIYIVNGKKLLIRK